MPLHVYIMQHVLSYCTLHERHTTKQCRLQNFCRLQTVDGCNAAEVLFVLHLMGPYNSFM